VTDTLAPAAAAAGVRLVRRLPARLGGNQLAEVARNDGQRLLLKVWPAGASGAGRELAASVAYGASVVPAPQLRGHGAISTGTWALFDWVEMTEVEPTGTVARAAGRILAQIHSCPPPPASSWPLRRRGPLAPLIRAKAEQVALFDQRLADRIAQLGARVPTTSRAPVPDVLLHGDYGWRNIGVARGGTLKVFDFEHAALGAPWLDLAKMWDRELIDIAVRAQFLAGYRETSPALDGDLDTTMLPVRLWAAAGIFPYAHATEDSDFFRHGLTVLDRLAAELPQEDRC
jgi:aminoglycoside phosphotransferase (APT) family kinase protein